MVDYAALLEERKRSSGGRPDYAALLQQRKAETLDPLGKLHAEMSGPEKFLVGVGEGMTNVATGVGQIGLQAGQAVGLVDPETVKAYEEEVKAGRVPFESLKQESTAANIGELAGEIASTAFVPGGAGRTLAGRAAGAAMAGGASAGMTFDPSGEGLTGKAKQVATGAAGGAIGAGALGLAGRGITKGRNIVKGEYSNKTAQEVEDLAAKYNVPVSTGDITGGKFTQKTEQVMEEAPLIGMAGFREGQGKAARKAAESLVDDFGIDGDDWTKVVQQSMKNKAGNMKRMASARYERVAQQADPLGNIQPSKMMDRAAKRLEEELTKPEAYQDAKLIGILEKYSSDPETNFTGLRALRSDLSADISDYYKGANAIVGKKGVGELQAIKEALDEDLAGWAGKQGGAIQRSWRKADSFYKDRVIPFKDAQIAKAMKKAEPDEVYSQFIQRGKRDRAKKFYNALDPEGRAAIRYGMLKEAMNRSEIGDEAFSPAKFAKYFNDFQEAKGVFFKGNDRKEIDGFVKLMEHVKRAGQFAENPPTGNRLVPFAIFGGALTIGPGKAAAGAGAIAAAKFATTNPKARRIILAASKLEPGSPEMERALNRMRNLAARAGGLTAIEQAEE